MPKHSDMVILGTPRSAATISEEVVPYCSRRKPLGGSKRRTLLLATLLNLNLNLILTLFLNLFLNLTGRAFAQIDPQASPALSGAFELSAELPGSSDSLYLELALIEIARAQANVRTTDFWHRLMPRIQLGATLGVREIVFPDAPGAFVLPKDSYRLSISLSPSEIIDGSKHTLAELELKKAQVHYSILVEKQSQARLSIYRKWLGSLQELSYMHEQMQIIQSLTDYNEILFKQGRAEFHTVARARLDLLRLKASLIRLDQQVQDLKNVVERNRTQ